MRQVVFFALAGLVICLAEARSAPKDPLRFYPADATQVVLVVPQPRVFADSILGHPRAKDAMNLPQVREALDSPGLRKFLQLVRYYEKDLGAPWPELLDQLAGDGLALGTRFGNDNPPFLAVLQGRDEARTTKLTGIITYLVEDELSRAGSKDKIQRKTYEGIEAIELSKELLIARVGDALLVSNKGDALKAGIDQHVANGKDPNAKNLSRSSIRQDAGAILTRKPLAWAWVNLKPVKELPQGKDLFASPRNEVVLTVLFAGLIDVARRSDHITVGLFRENDDLTLCVRLPAGRKDTNPDVELHLPKDPKVGGSLPPFDLPGMLACHSFYMDFDVFYSKREQIFPAQTARDIADGEKNLSRIMLGTTLPKFLAASGPHHRVVAVQPEKVTSYRKQPETRLPAVAFVTDMRDPGFAKSMNSILKAAALALSTQASLRSWEEEIEGVKTFGYSFPDDGKFPDDPQNLRFNYQPTFAVVENQYIFASNKGLCRNLIKAIRAEGRRPADNANLQTLISARGLGEFANVSPEIPLSSTILSQGVTLQEARAQTAALYRFLNSLGRLSAKTEYGDNDFQFELKWQPAK